MMKAYQLSMSQFRKFHRSIGLALLLLFLATGVYMLRSLGGLKEVEPVTRLLYRSRHIYILSASLVHLSLGAYLVPLRQKGRSGLQLAGSVVLMVSTVLLITAFFQEPQRASLAAPFSGKGMILLLAGTLCHVIATIRLREASSDRRDSE